MTALIIIGAVLLLFVLIGLIRAEVVISYAEEFGLCVRIAGLPLRILPKKPKKVRLKDYSPRAMRKKQKAAEKKAEKKRKKAEKKAAAKQKKKEEAKKPQNKPAEKKKTDIPGLIRLITQVVKTVVCRFGRHLRVRIARLHVGVASADAAETALLYGAASQGLCYLAALLDSTATLRHPARSDVCIWAEYCAEKPVIDIEIGFSICVWQVFDLLFRTAGTAIRELIRMNKK